MAEISRRVFLGATGALLLTGCSTSNVPSPSVSPTGTIRSQLDEVIGLIANGNAMIGVSITDLISDGTYSYTSDYSSQSASIAKPMIVLLALRKAREEGGTLSAENVELATKAITKSDNDAADALWSYAGGADAYQKLAIDLGLTNTHRDERPDWSWTWTTPDDQKALITALADGNLALEESERKFVFDLMGQVIEDQAWGIGAPRLASGANKNTIKVHIKNGWVQFKSSDGLWAVNSIGQVEGEGRTYRIAIMTRTPDFDTGRKTVSEIGQWVYNILGSGNL